MADNVKRKKSLAFKKYIKDIRSELKKVVWPSWTQLIQSTTTVLIVCILIGAIIAVFDLMFGGIFKVVFGR